MRVSRNIRAACVPVVDRKWLFGLIYFGIVALLAILFLRPADGVFSRPRTREQRSSSSNCPPGATQNRTAQVQQQVEHYFLTREADNVKTMFSVSGIGGGGAPGGQNTGLGFIAMKDWADRKGKENTAEAITPARLGCIFRTSAMRASMRWCRPRCAGWASRNGFTIELQNTSGMPLQQFQAARDKLLAQAMKDPAMAAGSAFRNCPMSRPSMSMSTRKKLAVLGLNQQTVNSTLSGGVGRPVRQRFHRSRPRQARLYPGRRTVSVRTIGPQPVVRAWVERSDGALLVVRPDELGGCAGFPVALQRHSEL